MAIPVRAYPCHVIGLAAQGHGVRWGVAAPAVALVGGSWLLLVALPDSHALLPFAAMWLAMTLAMMLPTVTRPLLRAADGSPARGWAFIGGFTGVWLAAGVPGYLLLVGIPWTPFWIALLWVAAGAYQLTPAMQGLLSSCRSVRFDGDPVSYGVRQGLRCVGSCSPVMLAAMTTSMLLPGTVLPVAVLVGVTVLLCWEKNLRARTKPVAIAGVVMLALASWALVAGVGGSTSGHSHVAGTSTS